MPIWQELLALTSVSNQQYFLILNERTAGPFPLDHVKKLYEAGSISGNTLYSTPGAVEWVPLRAILPLLQGEPPVMPPVVNQNASPPPVSRPQTIHAGKRDVICLDCRGV